MTTFRRFVAIGDSSTEGLEDPDGHGGYRGWADRLAQHIADAQDEPLEYANLAIRGLRMHEIRTGQLADALAMQPDLLSVFGGMNDVIGPRPDFAQIRADHVIIFGEARREGATVVSFTIPDPAAINPLGARLRDRVSRLNDIIRTEADRRGVVVMDFEAYPVTEDPRLWFEDRLHGNELGHTTIATHWPGAAGAPRFRHGLGGAAGGATTRPAATAGAARRRLRLGGALPRALAGQGHPPAAARAGHRAEAAGSHGAADVRVGERAPRRDVRDRRSGEERLTHELTLTGPPEVRRTARSRGAGGTRSIASPRPISVWIGMYCVRGSRT